jgi:hypothetical protein
MMMNSGYLTLVSLVTIGILLASGWKGYLFKGFTSLAILVFMAGWLISSLCTLRLHLLTTDIQLNLAFIFLLMFGEYIFLQLDSSTERLHVVFVAFLICVMDYTLREASGLSVIYIAIWIALLTACLQKNPLNQLTSMLFGFLCGNVLSLVTHQRTQILVLADQPFQDLWWFTLLLSRIFTFLFEHLLLNIRKIYVGFFEEK